jgi:hypothetical protein
VRPAKSADLLANVLVEGVNASTWTAARVKSAAIAVLEEIMIILQDMVPYFQ